MIRMLTISLLITAVFSHMYISSPEPDFKEEYRYDKYAPSVICNIVQFTTQDRKRTIEDFNSNFYFNSLRDYADECSRVGGVDSCNPTAVGNIKPFPSDGKIRLNMGVSHIGPCELWIDDVLVYKNSGLDNNTPEEIPVDFWNACKGVCKLRFIMTALHLGPNIEIFDNCVLVSREVKQVVITSGSIPTNSPGWNCSS
jgi:hypothetical protein